MYVTTYAHHRSQIPRQIPSRQAHGPASVREWSRMRQRAKSKITHRLIVRCYDLRTTLVNTRALYNCSARSKPQPGRSSHAKLLTLGSTASMSDSWRPNHPATACHTDSQLVVGITRPRPALSSWLVPSVSGYLPKMREPLIPPPMMCAWPPQPWSVPLPLDVSVRPNSEATITVTLSQTPRCFISATNGAMASSTWPSFDSGSG
eukprot:4689175-Prymnesium_polylepis.2